LSHDESIGASQNHKERGNPFMFKRIPLTDYGWEIVSTAFLLAGIACLAVIL